MPAAEPDRLSASGEKYRTEVTYTDRPSKARYIAAKYAPILGGSVLDVGCDVRRLAGHLPEGAAYTGVDMNEAADVVLNLDAEPLPFGPRSFDTVVCTDVLEHLSDPHGVLDQLLTIACGHVVVSLPNPVKELLWAIWNGSGGALKYYGLPTERPADRHRWFFGYREAEAFLAARAAQHGWSIEQCEPETTEGLYWMNGKGEDLLADPNIKWGTLWCVLKNDSHDGGIRKAS